MYRCVVDRFEGNKAVVEFDDLSIGILPRKVLPDKTEEGSVIMLSMDIVEEVEKIDLDEYFK